MTRPTERLGGDAAGAGPQELVLGIESSCDETAAAVVASGKQVRSSVVESQAAQHAPFGGVVPEIAGRSHLRSILPVIERAMSEAGAAWADIGCIAVTTRPGLIGSLLVGLTAAKGLAWAKCKPLVGVDHIEAHIHAATMERDEDPFPCCSLVVSGGHTALYRSTSHLDHELLGSTLDDAAGEAFDKVAQILGLGYPGGPAISRLATQGDPRRFTFPRFRPRTRREAGNDPTHAFSFSGLKTAVLYQVRGQNARAACPPAESIEARADLAASFQEAAVDCLVDTSVRAALDLGVRTVLVAGGVACNRRLREKLAQRCTAEGLVSWFPSPAYCTDNAAMVAGLGWHLWRAGRATGLSLDACASRG
jgi:N6-L-threonylcarbamoyladenine synthase